MTTEQIIHCCHRKRNNVLCCCPVTCVRKFRIERASDRIRMQRAGNHEFSLAMQPPPHAVVGNRQVLTGGTWHRAAKLLPPSNTPWGTRAETNNSERVHRRSPRLKAVYPFQPSNH